MKKKKNWNKQKKTVVIIPRYLGNERIFSVADTLIVYNIIEDKILDLWVKQTNKQKAKAKQNKTKPKKIP